MHLERFSSDFVYKCLITSHFYNNIFNDEFFDFDMDLEYTSIGMMQSLNWLNKFFTTSVLSRYIYSQQVRQRETKFLITKYLVRFSMFLQIKNNVNTELFLRFLKTLIQPLLVSTTHGFSYKARLYRNPFIFYIRYDKFVISYYLTTYFVIPFVTEKYFRSA
jgi:hypothetical protein